MKVIDNKPNQRKFRIEGLMVSIRVREVTEEERSVAGRQNELREDYKPRIDMHLDIGNGMDISITDSITFEDINATFTGEEIATYFRTRYGFTNGRPTIEGGDPVVPPPQATRPIRVESSGARGYEAQAAWIDTQAAPGVTN